MRTTAAGSTSSARSCRPSPSAPSSSASTRAPRPDGPARSHSPASSSASARSPPSSGTRLRIDHPLFDIRLFRNRSLAAGSLNLFLVFAVMFGIFLVLIQFLQAVLGFSALKASAGLLPMAAMMMPLSSVAPTLAKKFGTDSGADHRHADLRPRPRHAGDDGVRRGRLPVAPAGSDGVRRRRRPPDEPVDRGDHRGAAGREAGRRLGPQRHGA